MSGSWQMNFILQSYIELYCAVSCFPLINFVSLLFFTLVKTGGHLSSDKYHLIMVTIRLFTK